MPKPLVLVIASTLLSLSPLPCAQPIAQSATGRAAPVLPRTRVAGGVTHLEHDRTAFDRAPQLVLERAPVMTAGGADGEPEYDLTHAGSAALLSDGRLATFGSIGSRFLVFGRDGRGERVIGRQGQGPGEFMGASALTLIGGDTLVLIDRANNRISWVLADRGVVRSRPRNEGLRMPFEFAIGTLPRGRLVAHSAGIVGDGVEGRITRPPAPVILLPSAGPATEVARVPDLETVMFETRYGGRHRATSMPLRFGRRAHIAVWDTMIVTGSGDGYAVDVRSPSGQIVTRLSVPVARRPVTSAMRARQIDLELRWLHAPNGERLVNPAESERVIREQPVADSLPPYTHLAVTPGGTLWIVDYVAPGDTAWSATAFRRDGAIVGRLRASGSGQPMAFTDDRVVLRVEDADGVVAMRVHRIVPARR